MVLLGSFSGNYQDDVDTGQGSDVATDLESIRTVMNGLLDDVNIKPGAAINQSKVADLTTALAEKAPLAFPSFTGVVGVAGSVSATGQVITTAVATDTISEKTPASGVTIDGTLLKDGLVDGRDVSVDGAKLDGVEAGATADQSAAEILTAIKTVDGAGSGLDADIFDGQNSTYYLARGSHTGTQSADTVIDGTTNHVFTAADDAKLGSAHQGENHTGDVTSAGLVTTIAANAVTELKIGALAVTEGKIAANAVTETKIAAASVTNAKILDSAIENVKLAGMPTATFKGRIAAGTGAPENLTIAQVNTLLGLWQVAGVYATQPQSFSASEVVKFQAEVSSNGITINPVLWRMTVFYTGVYLLTFDCRVTSAFPSGSIIRARVNGADVSSAAYGPTSFPLGMLHAHFLLSLTAIDYVDVFVEPVGGGTIEFVHYTLLRVA